MTCRHRSTASDRNLVLTGSLWQIVINCSALPRLGALLLSPKKGIRKEACWTISNITAGDKDQIQVARKATSAQGNSHPPLQAAIDANIFPPLIDLLANAEFDIKKEAAWALSNATSGGTAAQIKYLVDSGCIKPLCDLLDAKVFLTFLHSKCNALNPHPRF
jgi:importin subunit alpha-1